MKQTSNPYCLSYIKRYKTCIKHVTLIFWMEVNSKDTVKVLLGINNFWLFKVLYTNYEYMCVC